MWAQQSSKDWCMSLLFWCIYLDFPDLSRPLYGALHFLCGKDFCHLQRAKYHRWKNPPVTSLFTLKAEALYIIDHLYRRSLKITLYSQAFLLNKYLLLKQTE
jgi:hypothetical protein